MPTRARHKGMGARPEAAQQGLWGERHTSLRLSTCTKPEAEMGVGLAGRHLPLARPGRQSGLQQGRIAGRGLGRRQGEMSVRPCGCGEGVLRAPSQRWGLLLWEMRFLSPNTQLRSAQSPLRPRGGRRGHRQHWASWAVGSQAIPTVPFPSQNIPTPCPLLPGLSFQMSPSWDLIPESQLEPRAAQTETQPDVRKRQRRGRKPLVTDKAEMVQLEKETRRENR